MRRSRHGDQRHLAVFFGHLLGRGRAQEVRGLAAHQQERAVPERPEQRPEIEVAVVLALIAFLSTVAFSYYMDRRKS